MDDLETREVYQKILVAGGGEVQQATLHEAIRAGFDGDSLTHIIADPWILEPGDPRHKAFLKWLNYERKVTERERRPVWSHGDGGTWKIFYTFLLYKLTFLHGTVEEVDYDISLKKIKREARARARLRQQRKIKEEEEELSILKETIVKRNPGRLYLDKSSGGKQEVFWPKSEQKRKAGWNEGSSQGKKVKKSTGWSEFVLFVHLFLTFITTL